MYLYVYDSFLNQKKYQSVLNRIENRLNDLEIKGKICKLTALKNLKEIITDGIKQGIKTVVAVGDDQTFTKVINLIVDLDATLGIIPVNNKSRVAQILGIPAAEQACDILAQRLVKKIDLGKINNQYFIDSAVITDQQITLEFDKYKITPIAKRPLINICNLGLLASGQNLSGSLFNPTDGFLEVIIDQMDGGFFGRFKKTLEQSIFPFKKIKISSKEPATIVIDQQTVFKTPAEISIAPQRLNIIVGSKRMF